MSGNPSSRPVSAPASGSRARACAHVLCVNQELGNAGLEERCRGIETAMKRAGGTMRELGVDVQDATDARRKIAAAVSGGSIDGVMSLGPGRCRAGAHGAERGGLDRRIKVATFDLSPEVLAAVRDRKMLFAVDQQPYLQGYLPSCCSPSAPATCCSRPRAS